MFYKIAGHIAFIAAMLINGAVSSGESPFDWKHYVIVLLLLAIYCVGRSIEQSVNKKESV